MLLSFAGVVPIRFSSDSRSPNRRGADSPDNWTEGQAVLQEAHAVLEPLGQTKYLGECLCFLGTKIFRPCQ